MAAPHEPPDRPPRPPVIPAPKHTNLGGSPGLLTSTGGLFGIKPLLLVPVFDSKNKHFNIDIIDANNFDTEEDAFYFFPSPNIQVGRRITINNVVLEYREIGEATFTMGVIVYSRDDDTFKFKTTQINIRNTSPQIDRVNFPFPDGKIHTTQFNLVLDGERPQMFMQRSADSGPVSIISATLVGTADVVEIMGKS